MFIDMARLGSFIVGISCFIGVAAVIVFHSGNSNEDVEFFSDIEKDNVRIWANKFGDELWELGQIVTRAPEVKARYQKLNVRVQKKDGETLLQEIVENVKRMLQRKMDAVRCLMKTAEDAAEAFNSSEIAENYTFYNAKNSFIHEELTQSEYEDNDTYTPMWLTPDKHFYNIPVNTSYSAVHVPTNVWDRAEPVLDTIKWSDSLDEVFKQNYFSDPALSFQYFGSSMGLMRNYPAMKWRGDPDLFDCRNRFWYIQAATCTKDIVILMDNSGSMTGYRNTIARLTVSNILDTLNNNDFVNVFNYSEKADEVVPCFKDMLVQATLENVKTLKDKVEQVKPEGYANLTFAFTTAFELLERYREIRGCSNSSEGVQCNQAIMLVTDGVSGNLTEVFEAWNWIENNTYIPVRVFTYLVGKEVTKVREIQWMACLNRGYYVHIHSMNEVKEQVFKYIPVFARPLVLQGVLHPTIWTPAYADTTDPTLAQWLWGVINTREHKEQLSKHSHSKEQFFSQGKEDLIYLKDPNQKGDEEAKLQEYRIMVSVSVPAFDRKQQYYVSNDTRLADLLGVAGTDVPIKDMEKLTFNYKSGVNGYAFIVTNNGYILLHPDLRPVFRGVLKDNHNSVDLTEVELLDDNGGPREMSPEIVELRNAMVNHSQGEMLKLKMKFHYDDIRRVAVEYKNYYFAPLEGTPFTMGLSLPDTYGSYFVNPGDEVQISRHKKIPITKYLKGGGGWKIHPDWTYCKYHHQTHTFSSPEAELEHFLERMKKSDWVWAEKYEPTKKEDESLFMQDSLYFFMDNGTENFDCNKRIIEEDEYYCDRGLIQLFSFDAKVMDPFFRESAFRFRSLEEEALVNLYNVTLKFVSTQSGLTRWLYLHESEDTDENEKSSEFGDFYANSIDEPWYKSAVLQHEKNPDSYVFSVPFDGGLRDDTVVTASHAIFPRDGGMAAPASVVGLQFPHSAMFSRFMDIASVENCDHCLGCESEELDCYVLDNNGFVVFSENQNSTGLFFGEIEGALMDSLRTGNYSVFRKVHVFDYQGLCFDERREIRSDACDLITPFTQLKLVVQWMFSQILLLLFETNLNQLWYGIRASASPVIEVYYESYEIDTDELETQEMEEVEETGPEEEIVIIQVSRPCDQKTSLYLLEDENIEKYSYSNENCSRPHLVQRIPHTNLLLVVIKSMFPECSKKVTSSPLEIHYNGTDHPCQKLLLNDLPRRRLSGCFSENPLEEEVKLCGDSSRIRSSIILFIISWFMVYLSLILHQ